MRLSFNMVKNMVGTAAYKWHQGKPNQPGISALVPYYGSPEEEHEAVIVPRDSDLDDFVGGNAEEVKGAFAAELERIRGLQQGAGAPYQYQESTTSD